MEKMGCIESSTEAVVVKKAPTECFYYFAIGSMINPVSLAARKIVPLESKPGILLDHEIYFFSKAGVAEALHKPGKSFHGVLHKVDNDMMDILDKIEASYIRKDATAELYDGS